MKGLLLCLALVPLALAVEEWVDDNFSDNIARSSLTLVKFYAPWCGHCKRMAPEFDAAGLQLLANDPPVMLAKVDCTEGGKAVCSKHGVSGYPTLKIFRGDPDSGEEYSGPREQDGIVKYMKGKAGPTSKELLTAAAFAKLTGGTEHAVVGFFSDPASDLAKQFQTLADTLSEDYKFAHASAAEVLAAAGHEDKVVIYHPKHLHNKFEPAELVIAQSPATAAAMRKEVQSEIHGLAGHRTASNTAQFSKPLVTVYYDVDYVKNIKGSNYWRNRVMKVAKEIKDSHPVYFAVGNIDDFAQEMTEFGLSFADKPVAAARNAKDEKFVMKDEFSVANLKQFALDLLAGELTPYLKSEPLPADNTAPVKVVVAKNFDAIVNDETKDVLIEFYAPWCGHCKSLAPKWDELATKLADEDSITIAKMDATANDVPAAFAVSGFPTLYYAPKNGKTSPRKYEGGREVKDFIKYLAKESTDGLTGYDKSGKKVKKTEL